MQNLDKFFGFDAKDNVLFANARSAIYSIFEKIKPKTFWLPSYLCESLIDPRYPVEFYSVDSDLFIDRSFVDRVLPNDLVLLISYFGVVPPTCLFEELSSKKAFVIEDAAQALFSPGDLADFTVYSFTKLLGLPDGAMLKHRGQFEFKPTLQPFDSLYHNMECKFLRKEGESTTWYQKHLNRKCFVGEFAMSEFSISLLDYVDFDFIRKKQVDNFIYLSRSLKSLINPSPTEVPLGFPISFKNRNEVLSHLIENRIYPPVHWRLSKTPNTFASSYELSLTEITLPCDWRYSEIEMERIIKCLSKISLS